MAIQSLQASPRIHPSELERRLEDDKRASLNFQILRRTLMPETPNPPAQPATDASTENHSSSASDEGLIASANVEQFEQVIAQRELELKIADNPQPQKSDPLVLDLARNGFQTRGLLDPVRFDLNADGRIDQISAPKGDDALLALDRNGNGRIDDGRELFGDQNGAANGFAELSKYDDNHDGRIDKLDAIFSRLSVLRFDSQGRQQQQSLSAVGVSAIHLQAQSVNIALGAYDEMAQLGSFDFADGRSGQAADLLLAHR